MIEVPLGTVARNAETGEIVLEITEDEETKVLLKGGRNNFVQHTLYEVIRFARVPMARPTANKTV